MFHGEGLKFLLENAARQNWGLSRNGRGLSYYIGVFLEIHYDAAKEKNLDVFIFFLTNTCHKIIV